MEENATTHVFNEGGAGITHMVSGWEPQDPAALPIGGVKLLLWVDEEVSHCTDCKRDNITMESPCYNTSGGAFPYHRIKKTMRRREVVLLLDEKQALAFACSWLRDVLELMSESK